MKQPVIVSDSALKLVTDELARFADFHATLGHPDAAFRLRRLAERIQKRRDAARRHTDWGRKLAASKKYAGHITGGLI